MGWRSVKAALSRRSILLPTAAMLVYPPTRDHLV
jgi:hypothetical protein